MKTIDVTVTRIERSHSSRNGNPTYLIHTLEGNFLTREDSACAYGITQDDEGQATLTLERGKVINYLIHERKS